MFPSRKQGNNFFEFCIIIKSFFSSFKILLKYSKFYLLIIKNRGFYLLRLSFRNSIFSAIFPNRTAGCFLEYPKQIIRIRKTCHFCNFFQRIFLFSQKHLCILYSFIIQILCNGLSRPLFKLFAK